MNEHEKDPFEKYDKLFEEADRKSVVQPTRKTSKPLYETPKKDVPINQKNKPFSVILRGFVIVMVIKSLPMIIGDRNIREIFPVFSFVFFILIINILVNTLKR